MSTFGDAPACFLTLIHPGAWKGNSPKLNFRFTEFSEVRQLGIIATSPDFLMIQLDRACPTAPGRSGRGYGPLWMRVQRPVADMFSLSLQVVGKNVSSSKRACVGRVVLLTFCSTYLLLLGNAAFALLPLCVARDLGWCDHDNPRWGAHNASDSTLLHPRARLTGFYHGVGAPTGPPLGAPTLRFAPPRCPKPSLALTSAVLAHNIRRYGHPLFGISWLAITEF